MGEKGGLFSLTWMMTWFVVLPSLFFSPWMNALLIVFALRIVLMITTLHILPKKLGDAFEAWKTPLLDFMYAFYYLGIGAKALFVKKVKWKN